MITFDTLVDQKIKGQEYTLILVYKRERLSSNA